MKLLAHLILALIANAFALLLAAYLIPTFQIEGNFMQLLALALLLTLLNITVKPILKLLFGPVIVLTLGFGLLIVNAIVLYLLDILSKNLTIGGNQALTLLYASLIIGIINFFVHLASS
jgi:putative membrane protein